MYGYCIQYYYKNKLYCIPFLKLGFYVCITDDTALSFYLGHISGNTLKLFTYYAIGGSNTALL